MGTRSTDAFIEALRKYLTEIRIESDLTQVEFAKRGGNQHQSVIARIETGASSNFGVRTLYEIAQGTPFSLWEIIKKAEGDEKNMEKSTKDDDWTKINKEIELLSSKKRKWLAKIVRSVLADS
ncbi:MAG: helix-turn-helix transcriptional regulator [Deltaproteobacteria bacterium]|nr:helix-turn-helix transcriptional regulator [Deltaproteobacteria bacterium]